MPRQTREKTLAMMVWCAFVTGACLLVLMTDLAVPYPKLVDAAMLVMAAVFTVLLILTALLHATSADGTVKPDPGNGEKDAEI